MYLKKGFQKIKIGKKGNSKNNIFKIFTTKRLIFILALFFLLPIIAVGGWFYTTIIKELPDIGKIDNLELSQATIITDKNDIVLYKLFEENRTYVPFEKISSNMVNAIIAAEDKYFWTNPGIDIGGIVRAGVKDVLHMEKQQGASTITQQLIKDVYLSREKTVTRKLKEVVLAFQLNDHIRKQIKDKYYNVSSSDLDKMVKQKILELYLNYIFLGNNAYGVESASKVYFGTSAQHLGIIEASILASIPKAPSKYNPYTNKASILGDVNITLSGEKIKQTPELLNEITKEFKNKLDGTTLTFSRDSDYVMNTLAKIGKFQVAYSGQKYDITYKIGRKDFILARMFEDGHIDQTQLKDNFIKGLNYKFNYQKLEIKAPHFVFWVIDELKDKYGEDTLMKGGLTIKTTLDYNIQQIAENSVKSNIDYMKGKGANNAAFVYLDSKSGDIISYVGSADFDNKEIDGQVDILQASRQPGSTVKPLLYALGFMKNKLTIDSPIYDLPLKIGKDTPANVDDDYNGPMAIKRALAGSRNIPAIKMYFAVGEEREFKAYLKSLGMSSLSEKVNYGYPMAIGGAEIKPMELANAYSHLSAMGQPAEIDPIGEIRKSDGTIIYKKKPVIQQQIIPSGVAYMIWKIVSDKANLPSSWITTFDFKGVKFGTKSGTTNVKLSNGKKLPRDGWLATYTPSKVAIFWAGNTKGEPMHADSYGGWLNSRVWKTFFGELKKRNLIIDEDMEEKEVKSIPVSRVSGKVPSYDTPSELVINSIGYINNLPTEVDKTKAIKVDMYCKGKVSDSTPLEDIQEGYLIDINNTIPNTKDEDAIKNYRKTKGFGKVQESLKKPLFIEEPENSCQGDRTTLINQNVNIEILKPTAENNSITNNFSVIYKITSQANIEYAQLLIDNNLIEEYKYGGKAEIFDMKNIKLTNISQGEHILKITAKDQNGYESSKAIKLNIIDKDQKAPFLSKDNIKIQKGNDGKFTIGLLFQDNESSIKYVKIYKDGQVIKDFNVGAINFIVDDLDNISYLVEDINGNKDNDDLNLSY